MLVRSLLAPMLLPRVSLLLRRVLLRTVPVLVRALLLRMAPVLVRAVLLRMAPVPPRVRALFLHTALVLPRPAGLLLVGLPLRRVPSALAALRPLELPLLARPPYSVLLLCSELRARPAQPSPRRRTRLKSSRRRPGLPRPTRLAPPPVCSARDLAAPTLRLVRSARRLALQVSRLLLPTSCRCRQGQLPPRPPAQRRQGPPHSLKA